MTPYLLGVIFGNAFTASYTAFNSNNIIIGNMNSVFEGSGGGATPPPSPSLVCEACTSPTTGVCRTLQSQYFHSGCCTKTSVVLDASNTFCPHRPLPCDIVRAAAFESGSCCAQTPSLNIQCPPMYPLPFVGAWVDQFGNDYTITLTTFRGLSIVASQPPSFVVLDGLTFNRVEYLLLNRNYYLCTLVIGAKDYTHAMLNPSSPDSSNPETSGCGPYPWRKLSPRALPPPSFLPSPLPSPPPSPLPSPPCPFASYLNRIKITIGASCWPS